MRRSSNGKAQTEEAKTRFGVFQENRGRSFRYQHRGDRFHSDNDMAHKRPLSAGLPAVAAETATGTGFYYAKAKVENRIKLMKHYDITPTEQSFNEQGGYYNG